MLYRRFRRDTSRSDARWIDGDMIEMAVVRGLWTATTSSEYSEIWSIMHAVQIDERRHI